MSLSPEAIKTFLALPALAPPTGVIPDFDNPPNQNHLAWGVATFCMIIATLCLLIRAYSKLWLDRQPKVEEGKIKSPSLTELERKLLTGILRFDDLCLCMSLARIHDFLY